MGRLRLIDDWAAKWWRLWSMRLNALGLVILGWFQFDPTAALVVWNMMPDSVREVTPQNFALTIGMVLFGLSMLSRIVAQPKLGHGK